MANQFTSSLNLKLRALSTLDDNDSMQEANEIINAIEVLHQEATRLCRIPITFSVTVTPGQLIAIYSNAGVLTGRLASAADNTKPAVGFASAGVIAGGTGYIVLLGRNDYVTGLTLGSQYYLSDTVPGAVTTVKPIGVGKIVQPVGFAISAISLLFAPNNNWTQL